MKRLYIGSRYHIRIQTVIHISIKSAGTSVAMGNASEAVRSRADLVTDTNEHDGVAMVLEQLLP